jgi:hypothetical protein
VRQTIIHTLGLCALAALFTGAAPPAWSAPETEHCVSAQEAVSVSGELHRRHYPGPPNYSSIRSGDANETVAVLTLRRPLCVMLPDDPLIRADQTN